MIFKSSVSVFVSVGLEEVANVVTRKIQVALPDVVLEALVVGDEEWGDK